MLCISYYSLAPSVTASWVQGLCLPAKVSQVFLFGQLVCETTIPLSSRKDDLVKTINHQYPDLHWAAELPRYTYHMLCLS
ncbi:hypothetical protein F4679DRAFT_566342 [Xylaria curta]|nr:hypothetical protein F4679DRAFT_566342 [Xylaria curta]